MKHAEHGLGYSLLRRSEGDFIGTFRNLPVSTLLRSFIENCERNISSSLEGICFQSEETTKDCWARFLP